MVRIFAGYIIEQDELVRFLKVQGWGPEPGEPVFTVDDAWMNFMSWRGAQPRRGDLKTLFPWPQYASHFPLSPVYADVQLSTQIGMISRCRDLGQVIKQTGSVLNPDKMQFWSLPEAFVHVPLSIPYN
jgi:hypothetical protein